MTFYVSPDYPTKKAFKDAFKADEDMYLYPAGLGEVKDNGIVPVCGPHYPKAHSWYSEVTVKDRKIVRIK